MLYTLINKRHQGAIQYVIFVDYTFTIDFKKINKKKIYSQMRPWRAPMLATSIVTALTYTHLIKFNYFFNI